MRWMWMVGALALVGGSPVGERSAEAQSLDRAKDDFAAAFDAVKEGTKEAATTSKYALENFGRGVVRVTHKSEEGLERGKDVVADRWIETKVKSKLELDRSIKPEHLDVESERGIVHLYGVVPNPTAAERAIELALDTDGVRAVDAQVSYAPLKRRHRG